MSYQSPHCPFCSKRFATWPGAYSHAKAKHRKADLSGLKKLAFAAEDDEPSMAERMIEAQLQQAMGGPVDEDWLLDSL